MEHWSEYSKFFITLIAVLDPFMALPVFLSITADRSDEERHRIARVTTITVVMVLIGAALAGETILQLLGASIASFRLGGGLVLLLMALAMLNARPGGVRQTTEEANEIEARAAVGVVPLAIPLLAGPGAISTVIIAAQHHDLAHKLAIIGCIVLVSLVIWAVLRLADPIAKKVGVTGLNVANRLLGLLLAAIAMEMMAVGLKQLFPVLAG